MTDLYSTCGDTRDGVTTAEFGKEIRDVARWTESAGLRGTLVFTDNDTIDPWAAAQYIMTHTDRLVPLVAVQPLYTHPYTAARSVSTLASLYGRTVDLNMVTGGYKPHLRALGGFIDHDDRYDRLVEYTEIMSRLFTAQGPLSHAGTHYSLADAELFPRLPAGHEPRMFVAGNSDAAVETAEVLGAVRLTYPRRVAEHEAAGQASLHGCGIRLGVIARDRGDEAWRVALRRFPVDSFAERLHHETAAEFQAQWHRHLWRDARGEDEPEDVYWLHPFRVLREMCPYLVGSYAEVAATLARYLRLGATTVILNKPRADDDLHHAMEAVRMAEKLVHEHGPVHQV